MERAKRFELSTPTLARLCSTPELRPLTDASQENAIQRVSAGEAAQLATHCAPCKLKYRLIVKRGCFSEGQRFTKARNAPH